jgi:hypothetical protein
VPEIAVVQRAWLRVSLSDKMGEKKTLSQAIRDLQECIEIDQ